MTSASGELPTAYLPSYSIEDPSDWWVEAALEGLRTSCNFNHIRLICRFIPGLEPTTAARILSARGDTWLNTLCQHCQDRLGKPVCDLTAEEIVSVFKLKPLSPKAWDLDLISIFLADISTAAVKLDKQIQSKFCSIAFEDWVAWSRGYKHDEISSFLDTVFKFRNDLVYHVRERPLMAKRLILLQKVKSDFCIRDIFR